MGRVGFKKPYRNIYTKGWMIRIHWILQGFGPSVVVQHRTERQIPYFVDYRDHSIQYL